MRNEDDNKETDPHYGEMLKVISCIIQTYLAWYIDVQCCDSIPMSQTVGIW